MLFSKTSKSTVLSSWLSWTEARAAMLYLPLAFANCLPKLSSQMKFGIGKRLFLIFNRWLIRLTPRSRMLLYQFPVMVLSLINSRLIRSPDRKPNRPSYLRRSRGLHLMLRMLRWIIMSSVSTKRPVKPRSF
jgi:hypothetical protein